MANSLKHIGEPKMKKSIILTLLAMSIITSGCADRTQEENRLSALEKRLGTIEDTNNKILIELENLKTDIDITISSKVDLAVKAGIEEIAKVAAQEKREQKEQETHNEKRQHRKKEGQWREKIDISQLEKLANDLKLSDKQKEEIKAISNDMKKNIRKAAMDMYQKGAFNIETLREAVSDMLNVANEHMRDILDPEQFEKYETLPNPLKAMNDFFNPNQDKQ